MGRVGGVGLKLGRKEYMASVPTYTGTHPTSVCEWAYMCLYVYTGVLQHGLHLCAASQRLPGKVSDMGPSLPVT